jgi:DNA-binding LacI/PurR family transcriptional regulator
VIGRKYCNVVECGFVQPGLKDVAARAGVSIKTVSNVVNGYVHVAPETRTRCRRGDRGPGLRAQPDVPGEVALIGFDDIEDGRFSTPTLSRSPPDTPRVAQLAVDLPAERLGDGPAASGPPRELRVAHRVLARESTVGR